MPRSKSAVSLAEKKRLFALAYAKSPISIKAAYAAGYTDPDKAKRFAIAMLKDPETMELIAQHQLAASVRTQITAQDVLEELAVNAFSDIGEYLWEDGSPKPVSEWSPKARRAVQSIKIRRYIEENGDEKTPVEVIELKLWDKNAALNNLAKHFGLLIERQEVMVKHRFDRMPMKDLEAYILEMAPRVLGKPVFTNPQAAKRQIDDETKG